ncbi:MAG: hypothetical protein ACKO7R_06200 [Pseudanabaena sp.]
MVFLLNYLFTGYSRKLWVKTIGQSILTDTKTCDRPFIPQTSDRSPS